MNERTDAGDACISLSRAAKILTGCTRTVRREIDHGPLAAFEALI
jgi:hypothetical protein